MNQGRRKIIKAIGAGFIIPADWVKPVIQVSHLPPHAQLSTLLISDLTASFLSLNSCNASLGSLAVIAFRYNDPAGGIQDGGSVLISVPPPSYTTLPELMPIDQFPVLRSGNNYSGAIGILVCISFDDLDSHTVNLQLQNSFGTLSNRDTLIINRPDGVYNAANLLSIPQFLTISIAEFELIIQDVLND